MRENASYLGAKQAYNPEGMMNQAVAARMGEVPTELDMIERTISETRNLLEQLHIKLEGITRQVPAGPTQEKMDNPQTGLAQRLRGIQQQIVECNVAIRYLRDNTEL